MDYFVCAKHQSQSQGQPKVLIGATFAEVRFAMLHWKRDRTYRMLPKFDDILACCASYPQSIPLSRPWPSLAMSLVDNVGWMLDNRMHCFTQRLVATLEVPTSWWDARPSNKQLSCARDEFQKEWLHATRRRICRLVVQGLFPSPKRGHLKSRALHATRDPQDL